MVVISLDCIPMGLSWHYPNGIWSISLVKISAIDPPAGLNCNKGNRRRSIGYCPHLWKSPLQPFQPSQQKSSIVRHLLCHSITSSSFAGNDELVAVEDSIDHRCGQYPMDLLRLPLTDMSALVIII